MRAYLLLSPCEMGSIYRIRLPSVGDMLLKLPDISPSTFGKVSRMNLCLHDIIDFVADRHTALDFHCEPLSNSHF